VRIGKVTVGRHPTRELRNEAGEWVDVHQIDELVPRARPRHDQEREIHQRVSEMHQRGAAVAGVVRKGQFKYELGHRSAVRWLMRRASLARRIANTRLIIA
jgi:hypothetical protein